MLEIKPEISKDARGLADKIFRSASEPIKEVYGKVQKSTKKNDFFIKIKTFLFIIINLLGGWNVYAY